MRPWLDWKTWCGGLAVIGTTLLLSPGVQVVEASSDAELAYLNAALPGPTCEASRVTPDSAARSAARARSAKLRQFMHAQAGPDEIIVLNNRGYNYLRSGDFEY